MSNFVKKVIAEQGVKLKPLRIALIKSGGNSKEVDKFLLGLAKEIRKLGKRLSNQDLIIEKEAYLRLRNVQSYRR